MDLKKKKKNNERDQNRKQKEATYHSLHIQNSSALIDVLLCCNGTGSELNSKGPLKLSDMVLHVAVHCGNLQKLVRINLSKFFNVDWTPILINPVMSLWIVF